MLVTGIGGRMWPAEFPAYKTVQRRLTVWLALATFRTAWQQLAQRYATRDGINWEEGLVEGSKNPAKKGANRAGRAPASAGNAGRRCTLRVTPGRCP